MASAYGRLPLNALRVFEAVATRLSFSDAAEALSVTPAAVSQQIRALEDYLQMPLLRRSGRSVELTTEGERLLPGVQRGLDTLLASLQELRQMRSGGPLKVSTLASVLQGWLAPRLGELHARHPGLQIEWHTSTRAVDFARSDFHAAIRLGPGPYEGLHAERLVEESLVAVASPQVVQRFGSLDDREDLEGLPMLHSRDEPWAVWKPDEKPRLKRAGPTMIDDSASVLVAASNGLGFAVTRWSIAAHAVTQGRLALASKRFVKTGWSLWFVCPEAYAALPKLLELRDWLREESAVLEAPTRATDGGPRKARTPRRTSRGRG